ncbi:VTT domain-containing protein [Streptomyces sp. NPDC051776]|uniref:VTT domain-containing protein n=1 Tax=Streptomyces sp. NPDC051776 TaxID=3155414 RepID=UPI00344AE209
MEVLWIYGVLALTTAPPLLPNSGLLVTAGVLASRGNLDLAVVLLVVAGSALVGDLLMHASGRRFSDPVRGWMGRSRRRWALLEWLALRLERRGVPFVAAVRFLPSGRLVGGLAAGVVGYPARRYLIGAGVAEAIWATYTVGLGYLGSAASGNPLYAAAIGIGVSAVVAAVGGLVQAAVRWRRALEPARSPEPARSSEPVGSPDVAGSPEPVGSPDVAGSPEPVGSPELECRGAVPEPGAAEGLVWDGAPAPVDRPATVGGPVGGGAQVRPSWPLDPCGPAGPSGQGRWPAPGAVLGRRTVRGPGQCRAPSPAEGRSAAPPAGSQHPAPRTGSR